MRRVRFRRVISDYLPAWCAAKNARDASAFDPEWSFLTPGLAHWFLNAIDEGVVEMEKGSATLPDASRAHFFGNEKPLFYREGVLEAAAAGMLVHRYGWSPEDLKFHSPRGWAFDLLAYADSRDATRVMIASEVKWKQRDAVKLVTALEVCCARGPHPPDECGESTNHHRKYQGILDFRPAILWIIGPDAFSDAPDLVFRVRYAGGDVIRLEAAEAMALAAASNH